MDRFLEVLGDTKTFFRECTCRKAGHSDTFVDNVIKLEGKYLPVEVKLAVPAEEDLKRQVKQYCCLEELRLTKDRVIDHGMYEQNVPVIDTEKVYLYDDRAGSLEEIVELDGIRSVDDIKELRGRIGEKINGDIVTVGTGSTVTFFDAIFDGNLLRIAGNLLL